MEDSEVHREVVQDYEDGKSSTRRRTKVRRPEKRRRIRKSSTRMRAKVKRPEKKRLTRGTGGTGAG